MDVVAAIEAMGGVATRAAIVVATSRRQVDSALRDKAIVRLARDRYALPSVGEAVTRAHAVGGFLCLTSAALHHGWAVKHVPELPHVSVPRGRKLSAERRSGVQLHRHDLGPDDIDSIATSKEVTLLQCLRSLPFDEALCIADSCLRAGEVSLLRRVGRLARGAGAARVRRVVSLARVEAANPFESCLRAIAIDVPGLHVEPQVTITSVRPWVRPDLVDRDLGVALEADSFEWHGGRGALRRDARRYNLLVVDGWIVLRFAWEDVMFDADYVRSVLVAVVGLVRRRTEVVCSRCRAA
jgi:very-short-patch-repair endonuclease